MVDIEGQLANLAAVESHSRQLCGVLGRHNSNSAEVRPHIVLGNWVVDSIKVPIVFEEVSLSFVFPFWICRRSPWPRARSLLFQTPINSGHPTFFSSLIISDREINPNGNSRPAIFKNEEERGVDLREGHGPGLVSYFVYRKAD